jgi:hypothetical protein
MGAICGEGLRPVPARAEESRLLGPHVTVSELVLWAFAPPTGATARTAPGVSRRHVYWLPTGVRPRPGTPHTEPSREHEQVNEATHFPQRPRHQRLPGLRRHEETAS